MNTLVFILFFFWYGWAMKTVIVASGVLTPTNKVVSLIEDADMVIAADGGYGPVCDREPGDLLSVIPVSDKITGLTLEGLEYPLTDKTLYMGTALGVSNVFKDALATIRLTSGMVLVTKSRE